MPALCLSVNCGRKQGKTDELFVLGGAKEIWLWFSTVFPSSSGHMAFLPRSFNLLLCLFFLFPHPLCVTLLALSSHAHLPHISVSVPGCWHNTDGPGSGKDVNLRERCLLWIFHCRGETLLVPLFALPCLIIAHWNLFFKLWKLLVSANWAMCIDFCLCVECSLHTFRYRVYFWFCADFSVVFGSQPVDL